MALAAVSAAHHEHELWDLRLKRDVSFRLPFRLASIRAKSPKKRKVRQSQSVARSTTNLFNKKAHPQEPHRFTQLNVKLNRIAEVSQRFFFDGGPKPVMDAGVESRRSKHNPGRLSTAMTCDGAVSLSKFVKRVRTS